MGMSQKMREIWDDPKQRVALSSVVAAIFLLLFKLYVGIITNSLGILSEALHSGLDFVAAAITMVAVISAVKPADDDHPFGHGKVENFSALIETILLLLTCFWIVYEAMNRIFFHEAAVEASWASFLVMSISIIVDVSRSRALYAAAKKYNSQALEADALHFSSDILSSSVVIAGLVFVKMGFPIGDPIAALGVAMLVTVVSIRLGKRTMDHLMDKAPEGKIDAIRSNVEAIENVRCERVRARTSGPYAFVDVKISLDRNMPLDSSSEIIKMVEDAAREVLEGADVVVQVEPRESPDEDLPSQVSLIALKVKGIKGVHNIEMHEIDSLISVDLHLELDPKHTVKEAHDIVDEFETNARATLGIGEINTHIETHVCDISVGQDLTEDYAHVVKEVVDIVGRYPRIKGCHDILVRKAEGKLSVNMHCELLADETLDMAHEISTMLERVIRDEIRGIDHVIIHVEPPGK
ncbi:MAG: cation-efflux pump [Methanobacteriota archaeon]